MSFSGATQLKEPRQNNGCKSEVAEPPGWLGVRSAHTLWYVSDE